MYYSNVQIYNNSIKCIMITIITHIYIDLKQILCLLITLKLVSNNITIVNILHHNDIQIQSNVS